MFAFINSIMLYFMILDRKNNQSVQSTAMQLLTSHIVTYSPSIEQYKQLLQGLWSSAAFVCSTADVASFASVVESWIRSDG